MGAFQLELDLKKNQVPFLREVTEQVDEGLGYGVQGLGCFRKGTRPEDQSRPRVRVVCGAVAESLSVQAVRLQTSRC